MEVFTIQFTILFILFFKIKSTYQDIYLHNPRGSNNRLNEATAVRTNANRAFDSQVWIKKIYLFIINHFIFNSKNNKIKNNNRGGYNIGESTNNAFKTEEAIYQMVDKLFSKSFYKKLII